MVIRDIDTSPFWLKIDGKWVHIDESVMKAHPGGSAITTYRNKEATTVFQTFHSGSATAGKWLAKLKEESRDNQPEIKDTEEILKGEDTINMGTFDISAEKAEQIAKAFDKLRLDLRKEGYFQSDKVWYFRKIEHHLFPTMPRHSLPKMMPRVKEFCKEYDIPYLVDDYFTGWRLGVEQFANVARVAERKVKSLF
ncbi:hypothetical protein PMAYCL1PPCAC_18663 [Pristionchus mayeri]|uniref:Fatty acid desaturase domain-containing protein n=1 Tax=Pristionchus mayeri TaxID=1317129 RepID=A0AAN5CPW8_9BILA|nr:hypothetical protein PMAYCL1PPCAC_18663 [Pristionchus mayeri]